jgi:hypothetical protein
MTHLNGSGEATKYSAEATPIVYQGVMYVVGGGTVGVPGSTSAELVGDGWRLEWSLARLHAEYPGTPTVPPCEQRPYKSRFLCRLYQDKGTTGWSVSIRQAWRG